MNLLLYLASNSYRQHYGARKRLIELRQNPLWYEVNKKYRGKNRFAEITIPKLGGIRARDLIN